MQVIGAERAQEACGIGMEGKEGLVDVHPEWGIVLGLDMIRGLDKGSIKGSSEGVTKAPIKILRILPRVPGFAAQILKGSLKLVLSIRWDISAAKEFGPVVS